MDLFCYHLTILKKSYGLKVHIYPMVPSRLQFFLLNHGY